MQREITVQRQVANIDKEPRSQGEVMAAGAECFRLSPEVTGPVGFRLH